ncbi:hypothetical protein [Streptomyces sp. NBC_01716]|uniref:hypothetical protein n=1 Tax=Streptomyces sp. NBC_01716 TaxID=2975917 RepID=UPI002E311F9E|nr:hypothetical protein [Streptomyces sp. NBC_01716]
MNACTHELIVRQRATPILVLAIEPQPGLHVYRQPEELLTSADLYVWRLGHHSGHAIAKFEYPGDADDAAWAIRDLADWTKTADEIRAELDGDTVRDALEQSPGIFLSALRKADAA